MIALDPVKLSAAALDGVACALCGRSFLDATPVPSQPVGVVDGGQIFGCVACVEADVTEAITEAAEHAAAELAAEIAAARPFWQTGPCPPWCATTHHDRDGDDDRLHSGGYRQVPLTTMPGENYGEPGKPDYRPVELLVDLEQQYREVAPRVLIGSTADATTAYLTLAEAERLALHLLALVAIGQEGMQ